MKRPALILPALLFSLALMHSAFAQESDYAIKKSFEERYAALKVRVESASQTVQLDSMKNELDGIEMDFSRHTEMLDKALYPESFDARMKALRALHERMYEKTRTIQTQGAQIVEMETTLQTLTYSMDTLTTQRDRLFTELGQNKANVAALRETVRRLQNTLQLKDKLLFTLVDSLFMPFGKDLGRAGELQRDALASKIEKTGLVMRVYDIAEDNVRFLEATELQGKDFANLIDHYQQFNARWHGLSEKMHAVYLSTPEGQHTPGTRQGGDRNALQPMTAPPTAHVDSLMSVWNTRLRMAFWTALEKEFSGKGIILQPFSDAPGFSASIRAQVETYRNSGSDPTVFVEEIWKMRIDREWRDALTREGMLGKEEFTALDKLVGELARNKFDMKFILYIGIIAVAALILWWLVARKPKPPAPLPVSAPAPQPPAGGTKTFGE